MLRWAGVGCDSRVVEVYRQFGDRARQTRARLKYLVEDRGLEEFGQLVQNRLDWKLPSPREIAVTGRDDHLGWQSQTDGSLLLGLPVESGRMQDRSESRTASAVRSILQRFNTDIRVTPQQNLLLSGVAANSRADIDAILAEHDVPPVSSLTGVRRRHVVPRDAVLSQRLLRPRGSCRSCWPPWKPSC
ncbi:MAG: hypothetical protein R3C56_36150 [Pirellulaceae bacterium]